MHFIYKRRGDRDPLVKEGYVGQIAKALDATNFLY